jgi:hypothetical protein
VAALQAAEVVASATTPETSRARLDRLGVPTSVRSALPVIKVATAAGLLLGGRTPRVGAAASAVMVAFYAAAVSFHCLADDPPVLALPAAAFAAGAAGCLLVS